MKGKASRSSKNTSVAVTMREAVRARYFTDKIFSDYVILSITMVAYLFDSRSHCLLSAGFRADADLLFVN